MPLLATLVLSSFFLDIWCVHWFYFGVDRGIQLFMEMHLFQSHSDCDGQTGCCSNWYSDQLFACDMATNLLNELFKCFIWCGLACVCITIPGTSWPDRTNQLLIYPICWHHVLPVYQRFCSFFCRQWIICLWHLHFSVDFSCAFVSYYLPFPVLNGKFWLFQN